MKSMDPESSPGKVAQPSILEHSAGDGIRLTEQDELTLQQLAQTKFWLSSCAAGDSKLPSDKSSSSQPQIPDLWNLTVGVSLHEWQRKCVESWFEAGKRGVVKVVTGAGKTLLGLAIAERLQRDDPQLRMAVVVPSIVLLSQWREVLAQHSNLPTSSIGLMGGGYADVFDDQTRILICVLNSAAKKLSEAIAKSGVGQNLLLLVDECHRAGAAEMRQIFATT